MITELEARLRERLRAQLLEVLPRVESVCPDPQCGDSTWDHECGLGASRLDEKLADKLLQRLELAVVDQALALIHDTPAMFEPGTRALVAGLLEHRRDRGIVEAAKELRAAWRKLADGTLPGLTPDDFAAVGKAQDRLAAAVDQVAP